jgi:hypothetical protein
MKDATVVIGAAIASSFYLVAAFKRANALSVSSAKKRKERMIRNSEQQ